MRPEPRPDGRFRPDIDLTDLWGRIPGPTATLAAYGPDGVPVILVGDGPRTCTSTLAVVSLRPPTVYDVNGFYAALGVDPGADRHTLAKAYVALGGPGDHRLTEILSILLDPDKRRAYDRMLPHQRFADTETVQRLTRAESERRLRESDPLSSVFDAENVRNEPSNTRESVSETARRVPGSDAEADLAWGYAYYLWGVTYSPSARADLPQWQEALITALGTLPGPAQQFAVGRCALGTDPVAIRVADVPVAFLSAGTAPQQTLAERVAIQLRALQQHTTPSITHSHAKQHTQGALTP